MLRLHQLACPRALVPTAQSTALIPAQFRGIGALGRWAHTGKLQTPYGLPRSLQPVFYQYPVWPLIRLLEHSVSGRQVERKPGSDHMTGSTKAGVRAT